MTQVFHRQALDAAIPVAVAGDGPYVIDSAGRRYLDGSCGAGVSCLGHSNEAVRSALKRQIDQLAYAHTGFFTTEPLEALAADLLADAPAGLERVWLANSGSEAMEAALKIARQYWIEAGQPDKRFVIGRRQGFLGSTLGALSVGGNETRRELFRPLLVEPIRHIGPCFHFRYAHHAETPADYAQRAAAELEATLLTIGPGQVAAFVCETVVGATSGAVAAPPGYFTRVHEICVRHHVLMILDEVMCGMGRTGSRYACEQEGIAPDLLTLGKGLAAGYQPISAVLVAGHIHDAYLHGSKLLRHGGTYQGHASASAAALAVQKEIRDRDLLDNVRTQGAYLRELLQQEFGTHPHVADIRGRGLMLAMEFVADRADNEPFAPRSKFASRLKKAALERGLMCYPQSGTIDGERGDHVLLLPPYIAERRHIEELIDKLSQALRDVLSESTSTS